MARRVAQGQNRVGKFTSKRGGYVHTLSSASKKAFIPLPPPVINPNQPTQQFGPFIASTDGTVYWLQGTKAEPYGGFSVDINPDDPELWFDLNGEPPGNLEQDTWVEMYDKSQVVLPGLPLP